MAEFADKIACQKCGKKGVMMRRFSIKTPPPVLIFQLKRFGYDWETEKSVKYSNHFEVQFNTQSSEICSLLNSISRQTKISNHSDKHLY